MIGVVKLFHPAVRGIRGRTGTELTAAEACEALRSKGFLATMDLSQACDRMSPHASTQLLVHMGWPPDWARLLGTVCGSQLRWMKWANHVGAQQLPAGTAVPQGCPAAPLPLQAWMSAGAYEVERPSRAGANRRKRPTNVSTWMIGLWFLLALPVC